MKNKITYAVAETESERQAYFAIRLAAFNEDTKFPVGVGAECAIDTDSIIIIAKYSDTILGGARLVLAAGRQDLPLVAVLPDYRQHLSERGIVYGDDCAEYGALAIIPSHRNATVTLGLYFYSETVARERRIRHVLFTTGPARSRLYRRSYEIAYGNVSNPPTTYQEVSNFLAADPAWQDFGKLTLSVITFHYEVSEKEMLS